MSQFIRRKGLLNAIAGPWPFWTKTHLITHLKGKHKIFLQDLFITMRRKRPFECHLCHERFGQKAHLITHLKGKHKMWTSSWEEIALLNAICGMTVGQKAHIITHLKRRHKIGTSSWEKKSLLNAIWAGLWTFWTKNTFNHTFKGKI